MQALAPLVRIGRQQPSSATHGLGQMHEYVSLPRAAPAKMTNLFKRRKALGQTLVLILIRTRREQSGFQPPDAA